MSSLRIAILGAGPIGNTLGQKWARAGHTISFGVKHPTPERAQRLREELGENVSIGTIAEALAKSDIVVLAVPGTIVDEVIATHAELLDHKIIIDAANRYPPNEKFSQTHKWPSSELHSLSLLQTYAPHAHIYRAFNTYSWQALADPYFQGVQADMFYCGSDGETQAIVEQLIADIGFQPVCLGGTDQIVVVDNVLRLWGTLAIIQGRGLNNVAFKVLTR